MTCMVAPDKARESLVIPGSRLFEELYSIPQQLSDFFFTVTLRIMPGPGNGSDGSHVTGALCKCPSPGQGGHPIYRSSAHQPAFHPRGYLPGAGGFRNRPARGTGVPVRQHEQGKSRIHKLLRCIRITGAAFQYKREGKREPFILIIIVIVADTDGHVQH